MSELRKRAILSGGFAGFALGCCVAWILVIVQRALGPFAVGPDGPSGNTYYYPPTALTDIVVLIACSGVGLGIGNMLSALIREDPTPTIPARASSAADTPLDPDAGVPAVCPSASPVRVNHGHSRMMKEVCAGHSFGRLGTPQRPNYANSPNASASFRSGPFVA
jgi:hypothetical protein